RSRPSIRLLPMDRKQHQRATASRSQLCFLLMAAAPVPTCFTSTNQSRSIPTMSPTTRVWSRQSRKRMTTVAKDIFERLDKGRPPNHAPPSPQLILMGPAAVIIPPPGPKAHPTEKFLSWLLNYWTKPTLALREICRHGPSHTRNWESAMDLAETLV